MPTPLAAWDAYLVWARTHDENPVTALDEAAVARLTPALAGRALLDAGCGTGWRLPAPGGSGPRAAVGVDLVPAMLARGQKRAAAGCLLAAGDIQRLPIGHEHFDVIWCRLTLGFVEDLTPAYRELRRVAAPRATLVVTDFHPRAVAAGYSRSFRDDAGRGHAIPCHLHSTDDHAGAGRAVGWQLDRRLDLTIGPAVRGFYEAAGIPKRYEEHVGFPFVLALRFAAVDR